METIIWPAYINSQLTRKQGRKISKDECVKEPKNRELNSAAKKLNLNRKVEGNKSYPSSWWEKSGRIKVEHDMKSKQELIRVMAKQIRIARSKNKKK
ncbi:MAG: signal recognition particle subunit SRP19/SEC65 family protein [Methanobacteriaceae archaeon]|nr:signal recognition particle subunit SRP19/SEC65 family protein [Methanobacteriaceae archaeon]